MKKIILLSLLLITCLSGMAQVADVYSSRQVPRSGGSQNNQTTHFANVAFDFNARLPHDTLFSIHGAKDTAGYVMFNTKIHKIGVYLGSGAWDTLATSINVRNGLSNVGGVLEFGGSPILHQTDIGLNTILNFNIGPAGEVNFVDSLNSANILSIRNQEIQYSDTALNKILISPSFIHMRNIDDTFDLDISAAGIDFSAQNGNRVFAADTTQFFWAGGPTTDIQLYPGYFELNTLHGAGIVMNDSAFYMRDTSGHGFYNIGDHLYDSNSVPYLKATDAAAFMTLGTPNQTVTQVPSFNNGLTTSGPLTLFGLNGADPNSGSGIAVNLLGYEIGGGQFPVAATVNNVFISTAGIFTENLPAQFSSGLQSFTTPSGSNDVVRLSDLSAYVTASGNNHLIGINTIDDLILPNGLISHGGINETGDIQVAGDVLSHNMTTNVLFLGTGSGGSEIRFIGGPDYNMSMNFSPATSKFQLYWPSLSTEIFSVDTLGLVEAKGYSIPSGTNNEILLADGTTTALSNIAFLAANQTFSGINKFNNEFFTSTNLAGVSLGTIARGLPGQLLLGNNISNGMGEVNLVSYAPFSPAGIGGFHLAVVDTLGVKKDLMDINGFTGDVTLYNKLVVNNLPANSAVNNKIIEEDQVTPGLFVTRTNLQARYDFLPDTTGNDGLFLKYDKTSHSILWASVGGGGGGVSSYNSRTGAVVPVAGDYATLTETLTHKDLTDVTNSFPIVNSNVGSFGNATHVPSYTVDGNGRITAASNVAITFPTYTADNGLSFSGSDFSIDHSFGNTWSVKQSVEIDNLGTTKSAGFETINTQAATSSQKQISPMFSMIGQGWNSSTSSSESAGIQFYVSPTIVSGAAPTAIFSMRSILGGSGGVTMFTVDSPGNFQTSGTFVSGHYTVSTLPTTSFGAAIGVGTSAIVTDATSPTYGATVSGGGSVVARVLWNGSNWVCE